MLSEVVDELCDFVFADLLFCVSEALSLEVLFDFFTFDRLFFEEAEAPLPDVAEALSLLPFELSAEDLLFDFFSDEPELLSEPLSVLLFLLFLDFFPVEEEPLLSPELCELSFLLLLFSLAPVEVSAEVSSEPAELSVLLFDFFSFCELLSPSDDPSLSADTETELSCPASDKSCDDEPEESAQPAASIQMARTATRSLVFLTNILSPSFFF